MFRLRSTLSQPDQKPARPWVRALPGLLGIVLAAALAGADVSASPVTHPSLRLAAGANATYVKVSNRASGKFIDGMGRTVNGANAGQYSSSSSNNQQWTVEASG